jgi:hypothetical protein
MRSLALLLLVSVSALAGDPCPGKHRAQDGACPSCSSEDATLKATDEFKAAVACHQKDALSSQPVHPFPRPSGRPSPRPSGSPR